MEPYEITLQLIEIIAWPCVVAYLFWLIYGEKKRRKK